VVGAMDRDPVGVQAIALSVHRATTQYPRPQDPDSTYGNYRSQNTTPLNIACG